MKKIWKILTSRVGIIAALMVIQAAVLFFFLYFLSAEYYYYSWIFTGISIALVLFLINKNENPAYKIVWICLIFVLPIAGGVFYLLFCKDNTAKRMAKMFSNSEYNIPFPENRALIQELQKENPLMAGHVSYILNCTGESVWKRTQTQYLSPGEAKFEHLLRELRQANKFIFLEYFIIEEGVMWNSILEILKEKAQQGVEIKLIFDDMGCINTLPSNYPEHLEQLGIRTYVFNPFRPRLNGMMNNRDHRKIAIIDGNVGFTGGINLADEYINQKERFGYWKDSSILICGAAVINLTIMFLNLWQALSGEKIDIARYQVTIPCENDGYVLPFDDNPLDDFLIGEMSYMNVINSATRYIYITTPYLVLDHEMESALCLAAQKGIDVRIITPHIPDKPYVFAVTRSYYQSLIQAGVKIYEFTPGFIHSKTIVADDEVAIVGTTNFDFRSFYLHFECGIWMYRSRAVSQVYQDFMETMGRSQEVTLEDCNKVKWYRRLIRAILRVFAPLM